MQSCCGKNPFADCHIVLYCFYFFGTAFNGQASVRLFITLSNQFPLYAFRSVLRKCTYRLELFYVFLRERPLPAARLLRITEDSYETI